MPITGPFPGMDPWLEARGGLRLQMLCNALGQLNAQLRGTGLVARIGRHVHEQDAGCDDEPPSTAFVTVVRASAESDVITAIEFYSPTQKLDPRARLECVRQRDAYRAAGVSTVEIDVMRDGEPLVDVPTDFAPQRLRAGYGVWVRRAWDPLEVEHYPIPLRSPLPRVRAPLREADGDAWVDLQSAFDAAYESAAFDLTDYDRPPEPPLNPDDAAWAREQIDAWRRRRGTGGR